ncbi:MAG: SdiA-regulated domain-containing protein [Bacteroidales bacterium]|nr:SdiA-regulated domain-containing protein [Bacteroidales bacterium]
MRPVHLNLLSRPLIIKLLFLFCIFNSLASCGQRSQSDKYQKYDINNPVQKIVLPDVLNEISGLVYLDSNRFACVQDEVGKIFIYSMQYNAVVSSLEFSDNGDYEGITKAGDALYIIRSDGVLNEVINYQNPFLEENAYTLNVPSTNCEGICFDKGGHRLLIVSKSPTGNKENKESRGKREIYAFELASRELNDEPAFEVSFAEIESFMRRKNITLPPKVQKDGDVKERKVRLRSSDIAIHPMTGDIYILAAVEYVLYVFTKVGAIKDVYVLNQDIYPKAEGITFNPSGELYITNESEDNNPPTLLVINYLN